MLGKMGSRNTMKKNDEKNYSGWKKLLWIYVARLNVCITEGKLFLMIYLRLVSCNTKSFFTLVELLIVISIIMILTSILLPALSKAKETGKRISCAGNMKQIYLTFRMYSNDYNGWYPGYRDDNGFFWPQKLTILYFDKYLDPMPYGRQIASIFKCPSDTMVWKGIYTSYWNLSNSCTSYGVNACGSTRTDLFWQWAVNSYPYANRIDMLGTKIMIADGEYGNAVGIIYGPNADITSNSRVFFNHNMQTNILFTDGHIKNANWSQIYGQGLYNNDFRWRYASPNY